MALINSQTPFSFPPVHAFPPFYTLQPNTTTLHSQQRQWSSLILSYCRHHRISKLSLPEAIETDLFYNKRVGKRLGIGDAREMVEGMRREGRAEWVVNGRKKEEARDVAWIWWRTLDEWAAGLYDWVDETGQKNTVLTLYELTQSEATQSQEFHGMDPELLQKVLNVLVKRGKASVFGNDDQQGAKFF